MIVNSSFNFLIGCSQILDLTRTNRTTSIISPNYPNLYPPNIQCYYYIRAPSSARIKLQFTDFNLPTGFSNGCDDTVEVRYYHLGMFISLICFNLLLLLLKDNQVRNTAVVVQIPIIFNFSVPITISWLSYEPIEIMLDEAFVLKSILFHSVLFLFSLFLVITVNKVLNKKIYQVLIEIQYFFNRKKR